jgi:hypothetical protein
LADRKEEGGDPAEALRESHARAFVRVEVQEILILAGLEDGGLVVVLLGWVGLMPAVLY